ncbi:MAG: hypothetical protein RSA71_02870 [Eubacterium sp.]
MSTIDTGVVEAKEEGVFVSIEGVEYNEAASGDGWVYDGIDTLTLKGCRLKYDGKSTNSKDSGTILYNNNGEVFHLIVEGENILDCNDTAENGKTYCGNGIYGIDGSGPLEISGPGTLKIESYSPSLDSSRELPFSIGCPGLTVTGTTLNVNYLEGGGIKIMGRNNADLRIENNTEITLNGTDKIALFGSFISSIVVDHSNLMVHNRNKSEEYPCLGILGSTIILNEAEILEPAGMSVVSISEEGKDDVMAETIAEEPLFLENLNQAARAIVIRGIKFSLNTSVNDSSMGYIETQKQMWYKDEGAAVTAVANPGFHLLAFEVDGGLVEVPKDGVLNVTMDRDHTIVAIFEADDIVTTTEDGNKLNVKTGIREIKRGMILSNVSFLFLGFAAAVSIKYYQYRNL